MARTPLLRAIARLAREHGLARQLGSSPDAVRAACHAAERSGLATLTRRDLLRSAALAGIGAAVGATAVPPRLTASQMPRIAIVGGGIAGLTAALSLQDAGIASTLYEASGRLGGRMFSATRYWADNQVSEWCGELINADHTKIQGLCRRFGLPLDDEIAAQPSRATPTYFLNGMYYREADRDFEGIFQAVRRDLDAAGEVTSYETSTPAGVALDDMSVHEWIRTRVPGGHGSLLGRLLELAFTQELGADTADQSALSIVYALGGAVEAGQSPVFGVTDERYHIRGGNQLLPLAIAQTLPEGSIVRGWRMTAVEQSAAGTITLAFHTAAGDQTATADVVILALPFAVLRTLDYRRAGFDRLKDRTIQALGRGRNSKLMVQYLCLSYSYPAVGQYHTIGGYAAVPQGNVYFAGEHCAAEYQGYMEGAASEGVRVADEVLAAIGAVPQPAPGLRHAGRGSVA
jgi:monoamine oxidase